MVVSIPQRNIDVGCDIGGNKNVLDVVSYQRVRGVVAHYDYAS